VGDRLFVVGIGGTVRADSATERALQAALDSAEESGAEVALYDGKFLVGLPHFSPSDPKRTPEAKTMIESVRRADGLIIASPGYHAGVSGMVKNALDYLEDLQEDDRPYLSGRAVGCIATGSGWQATVSTLTSLRGIVHALRGWPTPLGATVTKTPDGGGQSEAKNRFQLETVGKEVVQFGILSRGALETSLAGKR
jgi:FMN reductase